MALPAGYVGLYNILAGKARELGYAMALHGSLKKDMDLMCMPWTEEAVTPEQLIEQLTGAITFLKVDVMMDEQFHDNPPVFPKSRIDGPEVKPHGRLAWNIQLGGGCFLDISVMPPKSPASEEGLHSPLTPATGYDVTANFGDGKWRVIWKNRPQFYLSNGLDTREKAIELTYAHAKIWPHGPPV